MFKAQSILLTAAVALLLHACASSPSPLEGYDEVQPSVVTDLPQGSSTNHASGQVDRGRYMVSLLGCGNCHTDGALVGQAVDGRVLAGSSIGIAYTNPLMNDRPGVVFPSNLTPDGETGIGDWTVDQIVTMLGSGVDNHGSQALPVMPWQAFARLSPEDAEAIAIYLKSLPPVRHEVPANVRPGKSTKHPYVHFGVYQSEDTRQ